jgi:hypothetical protein
MDEPMKLLVTALAMLLTMTLTMAGAAAQVSGGPVGSMDGNRKGRAAEAPKPRRVDDKDYKAALKSLPDKPFDPWANKR